MVRKIKSSSISSNFSSQKKFFKLLNKCLTENNLEKDFGKFYYEKNLKITKDTDMATIFTFLSANHFLNKKNDDIHRIILFFIKKYLLYDEDDFELVFEFPNLSEEDCLFYDLMLVMPRNDKMFEKLNNYINEKTNLKEKLKEKFPEKSEKIEIFISNFFTEANRKYILASVKRDHSFIKDNLSLSKKEMEDKYLKFTYNDLIISDFGYNFFMQFKNLTEESFVFETNYNSFKKIDFFEEINLDDFLADNITRVEKYFFIPRKLLNNLRCIAMKKVYDISTKLISFENKLLLEYKNIKTFNKEEIEINNINEHENKEQKSSNEFDKLFEELKISNIQEDNVSKCDIDIEKKNIEILDSILVEKKSNKINEINEIKNYENSCDNFDKLFEKLDEKDNVLKQNVDIENIEIEEKSIEIESDKEKNENNLDLSWYDDEKNILDVSEEEIITFKNQNDLLEKIIKYGIVK